jgi:lipoprotein-releasing system ATP-binding protein
MLVARDVYKSFLDPAGGMIEVLRGVSLEVAVGEMVAVTGASGSGKTTLLYVLSGLEAADAGEVSVGGFAVVGAGQANLTEWRGREVGFVFQFHHLLLDLTATENVALPLMIARKKAWESREQAREILIRVGLEGRADHRASELSGGERQRVAVARALVARPPLVLADEPTGDLDAANADEVSALLFEIAREQKAAVIVATHNERLAAMCDRRLILQNGRLFES